MLLSYTGSPVARRVLSVVGRTIKPVNRRACRDPCALLDDKAQESSQLTGHLALGLLGVHAILGGGLIEGNCTRK